MPVPVERPRKWGPLKMCKHIPPIPMHGVVAYGQPALGVFSAAGCAIHVIGASLVRVQKVQVLCEDEVVVEEVPPDRVQVRYGGDLVGILRRPIRAVHRSEWMGGLCQEVLVGEGKEQGK